MERQPCVSCSGACVVVCLLLQKTTTEHHTERMSRETRNQGQSSLCGQQPATNRVCHSSRSFQGLPQEAFGFATSAWALVDFRCGWQTEVKRNVTRWDGQAPRARGRFCPMPPGTKPLEAPSSQSSACSACSALHLGVFLAILSQFEPRGHQAWLDRPRVLGIRAKRGALHPTQIILGLLS